MIISLISTYEAGSSLPFGSSMRDILINSFKELGIEFQHYFFNEYIKNIFNIERSDVVIFLTQPEIYIKKLLYRIKKRNNIFILWNVEPMMNKPHKNRYVERFNLLSNIHEDNKYDIDYIWLYDDTQIRLLPKAIFVPIGYSNSIEPKNIQKMDINKYIIVGKNTEHRRNFYHELKRKFNQQKHKRWHPKTVTSDLFVSTSNMLEQISKFKIGIDIESQPGLRNIVRWHRIMIYTMCDVCIMTNCDLSRFGFISGEDYLYFKNTNECENILSSMGKTDTCKISNSFKEKVKLNFSMKNILKQALSKMK